MPMRPEKGARVGQRGMREDTTGAEQQFRGSNWVRESPGSAEQQFKGMNCMGGAYAKGWYQAQPRVSRAYPYYSKPAPGQFEGTEPTLKHFIYYMTGEQSPDQYIKTTKEIVNYMGRKRLSLHRPSQIYH